MRSSEEKIYSKLWKLAVLVVLLSILIFANSNCKAQICTQSTDTIDGTCDMQSITPVPPGTTITECFIFKPQTEIIHLDYMLAQGTGCGPNQYSSLQVYIYDTTCTVLEHYANIYPTQTNLDAVLDTSRWYYMCVRFTASCTITAICPQYNLSFLPIILEYFTAKVQDASVHLEWMSSVEINSWYYEVQRADSNMIFIPRYKEYTPVFSTTKRYYAYTDHILPNGVLYYKLVHKDLDGTSQEYPIISIKKHKEIPYNWMEFYDIIGRGIKAK